MKTLYISDLDGTLLNKEACLSSYTIDTLNELIDQGLNFTVATARSAATIRQILAPLNLSLPVVLMNGVVIYDIKSDHYLNINYLTWDSLDYITKILKDSSLSGFLYEIKDNKLCTYYETLHNKAMEDFYQERVSLYNKKFVQVKDLNAVKGIHTIYFTIMDTKERLTSVYEKLHLHPDISIAFYKDIYSNEDNWYLEIFSVKATKYNAVTFLQNSLQFDNIIGFGDNTNDLPLFLACNISCAVDNAKEEVKKAANFIIDSNQSHGVVKYIRRHFYESQ